MNKQMKNFILVLMIALLLAACGRLETPSTPEVAVTEEPTSVPKPMEDVPTAVPLEESDPEQFSKYIGLVYPPPPAGLTEVFSMLMQDKDGYSLIMVLEGGNKMLWLNKIDHHDENGSAFWEVKDVLGLSNLGAGLTLLPDGCSQNGTLDTEIIVAGKNGAIVMAWRANTTLGKFEAIPINGIKCNSDKAVSLD
jgi:hypothetical protein